MYGGANDLIIMTDNPCFAHTMYCPRNLGDKSEDWENIGMEAKLLMRSNTFSYAIPLTEIPENYYYVVVIHYADGTVYMTDVKQK